MPNLACCLEHRPSLRLRFQQNRDVVTEQHRPCDALNGRRNHGDEVPVHTSESVTIFDAAAIQTAGVNQDAAIAMTFAGHDGRAGVGPVTHVESVLATNVDDAMLLFPGTTGSVFGSPPNATKTTAPTLRWRARPLVVARNGGPIGVDCSRTAWRELVACRGRAGDPAPTVVKHVGALVCRNLKAGGRTALFHIARKRALLCNREGPIRSSNRRRAPKNCKSICVVGRRIMISRRLAVVNCSTAITLIAAALIGSGSIAISEASQKKPGPFRQTTKDLCERRYTACVANCYISNGTSNASSQACRNLCYNKRSTCMGRT